MDTLLALFVLLSLSSSPTCQDAADAQEKHSIEITNEVDVQRDIRSINDDCLKPHAFKSCWHITEACPSAESGYYWIQNGTGQTVQVYCNMDSHCCNRREWMRVANVDMTDSTQQCPPEFTLRIENGVRACGRKGGFIGCTSTTFSSHGIEYDRVRGRIRAYQFGEPEAFFGGHRSIDDHYVDGISITHGGSPRKHIWTFVAALSEYYSNVNACPCTRTDRTFTGTVPVFVGSDYFCDTAGNKTDTYSDLSPTLYTDDPLWDGQGCGPTSSCCSFNNLPWFCTQLPQPTTDDIELRMCGHFAESNEDTPFDQLELYVSPPTFTTSPSFSLPTLIIAIVASLLGGGAVTLAATLTFLKCFFCGKRHAADSNAEEVEMDRNEAYVVAKCIPTAHSEANKAVDSAPHDVFDTSVSTSQVAEVMEELTTDYEYAEVPALDADVQTSDGAGTDADMTH